MGDIRDRAADLRSDNVAPACAEVLAAIAMANDIFHGNEGKALAAEQLRVEVEAVFAAPAVVAAVLTGTAANAISLALGDPRDRRILCHENAHIRRHEASAFKLYGPSSALMPLPGTDGKLDAASVDAAFKSLPGKGGHMLSIANTTELGTVYDAAELAALSAVVRHHHSYLHVDGARFGQAVTALGVDPHALSAGAGVDVLSLGMSKNGALAADAVVVLNPILAPSLLTLRKQGGHDAARDHFMAVQILRLLQDGLWLRHARQSNAAAARLASHVERMKSVRIVTRVASNQLFVSIPQRVVAGLAEAGYLVRLWLDPDIHRLVARYDTTADDIDRFAAVMQALDAGAGGRSVGAEGDGRD